MDIIWNLFSRNLLLILWININFIKEDTYMILLLILIITALILITAVILGFSALGSAAILIFGDVIVCIVFIVLIVRWLIKRKK